MVAKRLQNTKNSGEKNTIFAEHHLYPFPAWDVVGQYQVRIDYQRGCKMCPSTSTSQNKRINNILDHISVLSPLHFDNNCFSIYIFFFYYYIHLLSWILISIFYWLIVFRLFKCYSCSNKIYVNLYCAP